MTRHLGRDGSQAHLTALGPLAAESLSQRYRLGVHLCEALSALALAVWVGRQRLSGRVKSTQSIYAFIATSVRFFAFIFLMTLRTWTFTVLKHMFNSWAMTLFDFPS